MLKNWDSLPKKMQQEEVKKYYTELSKKRGALGAKRFFGRGSGGLYDRSFVTGNADTGSMH